MSKTTAKRSIETSSRIDFLWALLGEVYHRKKTGVKRFRKGSASSLKVIVKTLEH